MEESPNTQGLPASNKDPFWFQLRGENEEIAVNVGNADKEGTSAPDLATVIGERFTKQCAQLIKKVGDNFHLPW